MEAYGGNVSGGLAATGSANAEAIVSAGPLRRLGAMLYDALLVIGLLAVATLLLLPLTGGRAAIAIGGWVAIAYRFAILALWAAFFLYFWTARSRTLGMQVWRLRVERLDHRAMTVVDAANRLVAAALPWLPSLLALGLASVVDAQSLFRSWSLWLLLVVPLNYFAAWLDPQRRSLHDRILKSRIVHRVHRVHRAQR